MTDNDPIKCCGEKPSIITEDMTGDWEGIKCYKCGRIVYGCIDDSETVTEWNAGLNDA